MKGARCSALVVCCLVFHATTVHGVGLLFDFENDIGTTVTDKLTGDGTQNGVIFQNVNPADTSTTLFGTQSAFFDLPELLNPLRVSVVKAPDTVFPSDFSMTLAAFVNHDPAVNRLTRVFSTFSGAGATTDALILDYDPRPADTYIRAIVDGNVYRTAMGSPPTGLGTPGYHHYAMTVDAGAVTVYFDGSPVSTVNTNPLPAGYNYIENIQIGEDLGQAANEQLIGNVDEALVLQRALSPGQIAQLASGVPVSTVVTPVAEERSVYYDFEGDSGTNITDKFLLDGGQNGIAQLTAMVDSTPANARLGSNSLRLDDAMVPAPVQHSVIRTDPLGVLGPQFTLSATINIPVGGQPSGNIARLLSTYSGTGGTAGRLLFDINPAAVIGGTGVAGLGVRLILPDGTTLSSDIAPLLNEKQTITATYDLGVVKLYLNGEEIKSTTVTPRIINLGNFQLSVGEDLSGAVNEQFVGNMDDVLVISQVLTPEQVANLFTMGAAAVTATLPEPVISGDYNGDDVIETADYVVWRKSVGLNGPDLDADGNGDEVVDDKDYVLWKYNYGKTISPPESARLAPIPEPSTILLLSAVAAIASFARMQRSSTEV